jgi:hypothetical protein
MNRIFFLLLLVGLSIFRGNAQKITELSLAETIKVELVTEPDLTKSVSEFFYELKVDPEKVMNSTGIPSFSGEDFDFVNLYKCYVKEMQETAIVAPFRKIGSAGSFGFAVFKTRLGLIKPMLVKSSADMTTLDYYDLSGGETITFIKSGDGVSSKISTIDLGPTGAKMQHCAQSVMDCIADIYTNYGSLSVWTWVQSIFIPATGAAIALACFRKQCLAN